MMVMYRSGLFLASDKEKLDRLFGMALLDNRTYHRLVHDRDRSLLAEYGISEDVQDRIVSIHADNLSQLAQDLMPSFAPAAHQMV